MYLIRETAEAFQVAEFAHWKWKRCERDMHTWWLSQAEIHSPLRTTQNEQVIVIRAGELNDGPGPDIRNCHLFIDDVELTGSVEMHQNPVEWYQHHHDSDPAYDSVILHVVGEEGAGPDLPTLIIQQNQITPHFCLARRPVSRLELNHLAYKRYQAKARHMRRLSENDSGLNPLLLGMYEILFAGADRHKRLQSAASSLGMACWPDVRQWHGSRQGFASRWSAEEQINDLLAHAAVFDQNLWMAEHDLSWRAWDILLNRFQIMGISQNKCREWLVNILAPYGTAENGFHIWQNLAPFRTYGRQTRLCVDLGLKHIETIAEQQALLAWDSHYCQAMRCSTCPLNRFHQTIATID